MLRITTRRFSPAIGDDDYTNIPPSDPAEHHRLNHFPTPAQEAYTEDFNSDMIFHHHLTLSWLHTALLRTEQRDLDMVYISQIRRAALKGKLELAEKLYRHRKVQAFNAGMKEGKKRYWDTLRRRENALWYQGRAHDNFVREMAFASFEREEGEEALADAAPFAYFLRKGWGEGSLEVALAMSRVRGAIVDIRI